MKSIVIYSSKSGNTEKVAGAIASELNCECIKVAKNVVTNLSLVNYDFFFIGTGITYSNPNEDLINFLNKANLPSECKCGVFITWGGAGKTNQAVLGRLKALLQSKNLSVVENPFFCYGGWNFLRRGHPKADEIKAAKEWAKKLASEH